VAHQCGIDGQSEVHELLQTDVLIDLEEELGGQIIEGVVGWRRRRRWRWSASSS
jgi:hypothetical protein